MARQKGLGLWRERPPALELGGLRRPKAALIAWLSGVALSLAPPDESGENR
jgi:hypothetical protein